MTSKENPYNLPLKTPRIGEVNLLQTAHATQKVANSFVFLRGKKKTTEPYVQSPTLEPNGRQALHETGLRAVGLLPAPLVLTPTPQQKRKARHPGSQRCSPTHPKPNKKVTHPKPKRKSLSPPKNKERKKEREENKSAETERHTPAVQEQAHFLPGTQKSCPNNGHVIELHCQATAICRAFPEIWVWRAGVTQVLVLCPSKGPKKWVPLF